MTTDEQEALSFRYVAPRIFILSSGNIAICPMIGRKPPIIVEPQNFYDLQSYLPDVLDLERLALIEDQVMRERARQLNTRPPAKLKSTLEDLA